MKSSLWVIAIITILKTTVEPASILKEMFTQKDPTLLQKFKAPNGTLDFTQLVKQQGYPVEEHNVITEDDYVLTFYRIPDSPRSNSTLQNKPIVFLQHGAFSALEVWVLLGPEKSLAFLLADAGFDVWLGNLRGSYYGQVNKKYSIYDTKFWQYSYHEHAIYDLPALIDYVLDYTKSKKLNYIGHSMGSTMSYILLSTKPSYNEKFQLVVSLAPTAYWVKESTPPFLKLLFRILMDFKSIADAEGVYSIVPQSKIINLISQLCSDTSILQIVCTTLIFSLFGNSPAQLSSETLTRFSEYYPSGGSLLVGYHYAQNFNTEKFQAYDYGYEENMKRYNQNIPPEYDLKKVSAPVALIYGKNDAIISLESILELCKRLPNISIVEAVPYKYFNHADFIIANDLRKFLNDRIVNLLKRS